MDWEVDGEVVVAVCRAECGGVRRSKPQGEKREPSCADGTRGANIRTTMGIYDKAEDRLTTFRDASVVSTPP